MSAVTKRTPLSVAFVELYRQWPGYFADTFGAAQAGSLRRHGHRVRIFKAWLHADPAGVTASLLRKLRSEAPFDLLIVERVWDRDLLASLREAAGSPRIVVNQWETPAGFPEVDLRIAPLSREALLRLAAGEAPELVPNVHVRGPGGAFRPPAHAIPLEVARELAEPLDLAYDLADVVGLDPAEASSTRYLVLNMGCPYRGAANPSGFLAGLDTKTAWGDRGCTFCNVGYYERQTDSERSALVERQLEALSVHGPYRRLVVQDEYVFRDLDLLVESLVRLGPPGVDLMVRARVDYLASCEAKLVRALEHLGDRGTITPYLIGFESFSDAELSRYNKGQTAAEAEDAILRLDRLAARHPNLRVSQSQGFILFGPWTTIDDLERNLAAFRRLGFSRFRGRITRSKLRLNPDAALLARARADGLVLERHRRADEDNARDTGYQAEIPYRFQDARVERVWELLNGPEPVSGADEIDRLARALATVAREAAGARAAGS